MTRRLAPAAAPTPSSALTLAKDRCTMPHTSAYPNRVTGSSVSSGGAGEPTVRIPCAVITALDTGASGVALARPADTGPADPADPPPTRTGLADEVPISVWATAQTSPAAQRKGRFVPESTAHPAKMLPAIAAHAIRHYTRPGDLVLDPMCGIGTTLVEAIDNGRRAVGIEYERTG